MFVGVVWDWIRNIPATIWGSLLAGILTLLGVVVGQSAIYWREQQQKEQEVEALRNSLIVELRSIDGWLEQLLYTAPDLERAKENAYSFSEEEHVGTFESDLQARLALFLNSHNEMSFAEKIYESNADKIGALGPEAAKQVVGAYRAIETLEQSLQEFGNTISYEGVILDPDIDWDSGEGLGAEVWLQKEEIKNAVLSAVVRQKFALRTLGDPVSENDRAAVAFTLRKQTPRSKEHEQLQNFLDWYMEENNLTYEELAKGNHPAAQKNSTTE